MTTYTNTDFYGSVEDIISTLPFWFSTKNSDITVTSFIDGYVTITVCFGTGKGWDTLAETLDKATEESFAWGAYTLGIEEYDEYGGIIYT